MNETNEQLIHRMIETFGCDPLISVIAFRLREQERRLTELGWMMDAARQHAEENGDLPRGQS